MTSKKLGRFDVDGEISASALGPLHRARAEGSPFLARVVKLRPPLGKADAEALHEAAKGGVGLYHPCVASFTEGHIEGSELALFFAGDGEALATLQKRALLGRKPFPGPVLLRLVIDLADGVQALTEHAAAAGKTAPYGGITPENVIVGDDGVARVVDLLPSAAATADTWVRAPRRAAYQAPEAFRKEPLTAASDVFSLGVLAWELASNRSLFVSASLAEIEKRVLAPSKRADAVKPAGGEALDAKAVDVIERALSLTAAGRPASAADLAASLRDAGVALATHDEIAAYVRSLGDKPGSVKTPAPSETKPKASEPQRPAPKPAAPKAPVAPSTPAISKSIDDALDDLDVVSLHSVRLPPPPPVRRPIPLGKPVAPAPAKKPAATDDIDVSFDDAGATSVEPPAPSSPAPSSPAPSSGETPRPSSPFGLSKSLIPPPDPEAPPSVPSLGAPAAPAEASTTAPARPAPVAEKAEPKAQLHDEKAGAEGPEAAKAKHEEAESKEALSEKAESKEAESKEALSEKAESKEALSEKAESKEALSEKAESKEAESEGAPVEVKAVEAKPAEPAPAPASTTPEAAPKAAQSRRSFEAPKPVAAASAETAAPLFLAPPSLPTVAANDAETPPAGKKSGLGLWIGGGLLALVAVLAFAFLGGSDDKAPPPSVTPTTGTTVATAPTAAPAPPPPEAALAAPIPTPEPLATAAPTASEAPAPVPTPAAAPSPVSRPAQATNAPPPAPTAAKPTGAKPASKPAAAPPKGNSKKYIPGGI